MYIPTNLGVRTHLMVASQLAPRPLSFFKDWLGVQASLNLRANCQSSVSICARAQVRAVWLGVALYFEEAYKWITGCKLCLAAGVCSLQTRRFFKQYRLAFPGGPAPSALMNGPEPRMQNKGLRTSKAATRGLTSQHVL